MTYEANCKRCKRTYVLLILGVPKEWQDEVVARAIYGLGWIYVNKHWYCPSCLPQVATHGALYERVKYLRPTVRIMYER